MNLVWVFPVMTSLSVISCICYANSAKKKIVLTTNMAALGENQEFGFKYKCDVIIGIYIYTRPYENQVNENSRLFRTFFAITSVGQ